jgi:crotonobetainyl-CoA:carnitine CoA-transferase CaiB-like acyl-CoA transferase
VESSLHFLAPLLLDYRVTGHEATRRGNHEDGASPSNAYPCREDAWIAITVEGDREFGTLCAVLGVPALAEDPRLASHALRKANEAALDAEIDGLTTAHDAYDLAYRLQEAGIAAGPVARASDLFADPQYSHRNLFRRLVHPEIGDHAVITHSFRIAGLEPGPWRAAPCLGEHTHEIARDLLGMDDETIAALIADGTLE